ncbi:Guanine nucleotide-binding protein-like 3, partial [Phytophthora palmivora]
LAELYQLPVDTVSKCFKDAVQFLVLVAQAKGKLGKGGIPDRQAAARIVLQDWNRGKLPYFTPPPDQSVQVLDTQLVTSFGQEFNVADEDLNPTSIFLPDSDGSKNAINGPQCSIPVAANGSSDVAMGSETTAESTPASARISQMLGDSDSDSDSDMDSDSEMADDGADPGFALPHTALSTQELAAKLAQDALNPQTAMAARRKAKCSIPVAANGSSDVAMGSETTAESTPASARISQMLGDSDSDSDSDMDSDSEMAEDEDLNPTSIFLPDSDGSKNAINGPQCSIPVAANGSSDVAMGSETTAESTPASARISQMLGDSDSDSDSDMDSDSEMADDGADPGFALPHTALSTQELAAKLAQDALNPQTAMAARRKAKQWRKLKRRAARQQLGTEAENSFSEQFGNIVGIAAPTFTNPFSTQ